MKYELIRLPVTTPRENMFKHVCPECGYTIRRLTNTGTYCIRCFPEKEIKLEIQ